MMASASSRPVWYKFPLNRGRLLAWPVCRHGCLLLVPYRAHYAQERVTGVRRQSVRITLQRVSDEDSGLLGLVSDFTAVE